MRKFYRSRIDRKIAGICGGLGEMFATDPTLFRVGLIFLAVFFAFIPVIAAYVVAWLIVPEAPIET